MILRPFPFQFKNLSLLSSLPSIFLIKTFTTTIQHQKLIPTLWIHPSNDFSFVYCILFLCYILFNSLFLFSFFFSQFICICVFVLCVLRNDRQFLELSFRTSIEDTPFAHDSANYNSLNLSTISTSSVPSSPMTPASPR